MKYLKIFLKLELKRFSSIRWIMVFSILLLVFSILFTNIGIGQYKYILNQKEKFRELEKVKTDHYVTYTQYGTYGILFKYIPNPVSVFFMNSAPVPGITAYVDSGERLKIYHSLKGKNIFELKKYGFTDFSGIILVFGSLLTLFYAIDVYRTREYIKFLASLIKTKELFRVLLLSRLIILFFLLLVIAAANLLSVVIQGIVLPLDIYLFIFLGMILLIILFFFGLGAVFASFSAKVNSYISCMATWFILVFVIPAAILYFISWRSNSIPPVEELEMKKFKLIMEFEKRAIEKAGQFNYGKSVTDARKEVILDYYRNELVKINSIEKDYRLSMEEYILKLQQFSTIFPTAFYISVTNGISSMGYYNLVDFQEKVQDEKNGFFKFIMDKIYFTEDSNNFARVESYLKNDKNIYYAGSRLPHGFLAGLLLSLVYTTALFRLALYRFKQFLLKLPGIEEEDTGHVDIELNKGDFKVVVSEDERFKQKVYNRLLHPQSRPAGVNVTFTVKGSDIEQGNMADSIYICHPDHFPGDIKVNYFIAFIGELLNLKVEDLEKIREKPGMKSLLQKKLKQLKRHERGKLLLNLIEMTAKELYLVNDAVRGLPLEIAVGLKEKLEKLQKNGAIVLYLTSADMMVGKITTGSDNPVVYDSPHWGPLLDHYKKLYDI